MAEKMEMKDRRFGRLVVGKCVGINKHREAMWACKCDCGNVKTVRGSDLRNGATKSCGCLSIEITRERCTTHGLCRTTEHNTWSSMINRCNNPKDTNYHYYGERGIKVCDRWLKFEGFFEDMGKRPEGLTLERRDNEIGYSKENCCWASYAAQSKNKRVQERSKTGVTGVTWLSDRQKYRVGITVKRKYYNIGQFSTLEQAKEARLKAEQEYWL